MTAGIPASLDHRALEALFAQVLEALEAGAPDASALWMQFDQALTAHFEHEETSLLVDLLAVRPRETRVVLEEHRYLRNRLAQLRATLPAVPVDSVRTFLDELRAHGAHEERVLYRWAESRSSTASSAAKSSST